MPVQPINQLPIFQDKLLADNYGRDDIDGRILITKVQMEPGDYVAVLLPPEGVSVISWNESGEFIVTNEGANPGEIFEWGIGEKYHPDNNEVVGPLNIINQVAGAYLCISHIDFLNKAIFGWPEFAVVGRRYTAEPGQWLALVSGKYIFDDVLLSEPGLIYAEDEMTSVRCFEPGYIVRIEVGDVSEIEDRYNDPI